VALLIRQRLEQLELEQRDLATAAQVTESYISQLLTCKKAPLTPGRTDIYDKMGDFLKLPSGELAKLADLQRREELKKTFGQRARNGPTATDGGVLAAPRLRSGGCARE
jgi:transcriptional regulator with XRE-family HTH domain